MRKIIGLLILFLTLPITYPFMGGNLSQLIQVIPLSSIILSVIGALCISFPINVICNAFFVAIFTPQTINKEHIKIYLKVLAFAGKCAIGFGIISMLLGLVLVFQNLTEPSKLGSGLSVAIMSPIYGFILAYALFFPLSMNLENNVHYD